MKAERPLVTRDSSGRSRATCITGSWDLAAGAGAADPEALAKDLVLVLNGALATAAVLGPDGPSRRTVALAAHLIDAALA